MPNIDRRRFLQLSGGVAALSLLPNSIARAAGIPANRATGSIRDVEHIVVLMQENRSFDHYFGAMKGVRGFGDPHPVTLPSGKSVWHQADGTREVLPFRPDVSDLGLAFIQDLDHSWNGGHQAFNQGRYDQWIPTKSATTMAHLKRRDMPFHYALADAFTVCDSYHCSSLTSTDPNRYYMWTGWVGNDGKGGGPVINNAELGYDWTTYPERLERAGVSWKIYQDTGVGLDADGGWGWTPDAYIGNYGDNSLLYFDRYRSAAPGSPLYRKARTGTSAIHGQGFFDILTADVKADRLPEVSWVVAPEAFTEHPNWPANYGAWYVSKVLDALTSDPEVWSKTALFITYDENDGFFDHVVPPYPNTGGLPGGSTVSTANEFYTGPDGEPGNYGLGVRVPMLVLSPWSTGGWVCSQTFDHTSIIQFIERRFGVHEPNITPWRRALCGDLTAAFDFSRTHPKPPLLPPTARYRPKDDQRHPDFVPEPPADPRLPRQEPGVRPSRRLGYSIDVDAAFTAATITLDMHNTGTLGAHLQVRSAIGAILPSTYTIHPGRSLSGTWPTTHGYDLSVHGPNGYYRHFVGAAGRSDPQVSVRPAGRDPSALLVTIHNPGRSEIEIDLANAYHGHTQLRVPARTRRSVQVPTQSVGGWYDLVVTVAGDRTYERGLAGRLECGQHLTSDPQLGR